MALAVNYLRDRTIHKRFWLSWFGLLLLLGTTVAAQPAATVNGVEACAPFLKRVPFCDSSALLWMPSKSAVKSLSGAGQTIEYRFPVENLGKVQLSLEILAATCDCSVSWSHGNKREMTLMPGGHGEVVVSCTIQSLAPFHESVTLRTNDPRHRKVHLLVRGGMPPGTTLTPPVFYVMPDPGEKVHESFQITVPAGNAVRGLWSDLPYLRFKIGQKSRTRVGVTEQISVDGFAGAPAGSVDGRIYVQLRNGMKVWVRVLGEIPAARGKSKAVAPSRKHEGGDVATACS